MNNRTLFGGRDTRLAGHRRADARPTSRGQIAPRIWLPLLALLLILSGCGAKPAERAASAPADTGQAAGVDGAAAAEPAASEPVTLTVSAAASLTDALGELERAYEAEHPYVKLDFNFGASGALQRQIEQGAPADLFLSASSPNMQALLDGGLIDAAYETDWLTNTLVAVVPTDSTVAKIEDLRRADVKTIAIGMPDSVPAGKYAQEALAHAGLWEPLQGKLVQGKDVRQVLQYAETGNADAGFVYKTDALTSNRVKIAFDVDPAGYSPIRYPIGVVKATGHAGAARDFYAYLQTPEALKLLSRYGFSAAQ